MRKPIIFTGLSQQIQTKKLVLTVETIGFNKKNHSYLRGFLNKSSHKNLSFLRVFPINTDKKLILIVKTTRYLKKKHNFYGIVLTNTDKKLVLTV